MELSKLLNCRIQKIGVSVSDDLILQQFISTNSVFQTVQNQCSTDHLFNKYLTDYLDLNSPIEKFIGIPSAAPEIVTETTSENALISPNISVTVSGAAVVSEPSRENASSVGDNVTRGSRKFVRLQYVPILTTLKNYLEQPDVCASFQAEQPNEGEMLRNFSDGKL